MEQQIGHYSIEGLLGSGGMGEVYLGVDRSLERKVAIKVLKQNLLGNTGLVDRFRSEAITLARLNHPNVATVYAFLKENDHYYLVTEFINGWNIGDLIARNGALPIDICVYLFKQILTGIAIIHKNGIVHRDLKPSNIMVTNEFNVKVMDFGLAQFQVANRLTQHGRLMGTLEYMSPEQIKGEPVNYLTDIYSLGIVLYEMLTGRLPFSSQSEYELMKAQVEESPPSPLFFNDAVSQSIITLIDKALAKQPEQRFQSVAEFLEALNEYAIDMSSIHQQLEQFVDQGNIALPIVQSGVLCNQLIENPLDHKKKAALSRPPNMIWRFMNRIKNLFARWVLLGPMILLLSIGIVASMHFIQTKTLPDTQNAITEKVAQPIIAMPLEIKNDVKSIDQAVNNDDDHIRTKQSESISLSSDSVAHRRIENDILLPPLPQRTEQSSPKKTIEHEPELRSGWVIRR